MKVFFTTHVNASAQGDHLTRFSPPPATVCGCVLVQNWETDD
jgi:hypothetical protein